MPVCWWWSWVDCPERRGFVCVWIVSEIVNHIVREGLSRDMFFLCDVEFPCVFDVERGLKVLCHYIAFIVLTGHSPNPHFAIHVILSIAWCRVSIERECSFIVGWVAMCSAAWLSVRRK